jgi:hypothetical protein
MSPSGLRARAVDFFIEPREAPPAPPGLRAAPRTSVRAATRPPLRAAVLGSAADAVPVAGMLANALRSASGASTAAVAVWAPGASLGRGGPAALGASRLAARLTARGLPAVARGRLAWLRLDDHPVAAAVAVRRAAGALDVPLVAVLGGPRCEVIEGLIDEQDLVLVVAGEPDGPLVRLAVDGCAGAAVAHGACAPGPARWLALAGLAGAHGLARPVRGLVRELAAPHAVEEAAW